MNKLKSIFKVFITTIFLFFFGCSSDSVEEINNILVKSIVIYGDNITDGVSSQLSSGIIPNNATNKDVTWSVLDNSVALISNTGLLTAVSNGNVTVKATANDGSGVFSTRDISVTGYVGPAVLVQTINVSGSDITDGTSSQFLAEILPINASNKQITWSVSDSNLAEINTDGLLTPKDNGTLTVIATAKDSSGIFGELVVNILGVTPAYATTLKAENVLLWQRSNGGWPKEPHNDFSGYDRAQTSGEIATANSTKNNTDTTIDNEHTIGEIRILLSAYKITNNPAYLEAAKSGVDFLFEMQYDNGGWPQYYPLRTNYSRHITYNDNAMGNVMNLMRDIFLKRNDLDLIDESYVSAAQTAFDKGIQVILDTQVTINGEKTAWCAQHDATTLLPADARDYELASNSGSESVGVVRLLMTLDNPSSEVINAVNSAVAWFESVKIVGYRLQDSGGDKVLVASPGNVMWGRFYTLGDYTGHPYEPLFNTFGPNEPFFCSRVADAEGGGPRKTIAEISYERRNGYAWYGNWPNNLIGSEYTSWKNKNGI